MLVWPVNALMLDEIQVQVHSQKVLCASVPYIKRQIIFCQPIDVNSDQCAQMWYDDHSTVKLPINLSPVSFILNWWSWCLNELFYKGFISTAFFFLRFTTRFMVHYSSSKKNEVNLQILKWKDIQDRKLNGKRANNSRQSVTRVKK